MATLPSGPADLPLACHAVVDTTDPDRAREEVGRIFCAHRLVPLGAVAEGFRARHHSVRGRGFSVNLVSYGSRVEIDPGCLDRFFLLQLPLRGAARVTCGGREVEAGVRRGTLLSPTLPTRMVWEAGCDKLILLLDRAGLEGHLARLLDAPPRPVEFDPALDVASPGGAAVLAQARLLLHLAEAGLPPGPLAAELLAGLQATLLSALPHTASARLRAEAASPAAPVQLKRAEAYETCAQMAA